MIFKTLKNDPSYDWKTNLDKVMEGIDQPSELYDYSSLLYVIPEALNGLRLKEIITNEEYNTKYK